MKHWPIFLGAFVVSAEISSAAALGAQGLNGYFYGPSAALPTTLVEMGDSGRFRLLTARSASSEEELELIVRAESLYPAPELISDSVEAHLSDPNNRIGIWEERFAEAATAPVPRWWWLLEDDLGLPFGLTAQAVAQYLERFRSLRSGPTPHAEYDPGVAHRAELIYAATVRSEGSGKVVELWLR